MRQVTVIMQIEPSEYGVADDDRAIVELVSAIIVGDADYPSGNVMVVSGLVTSVLD